MEEIDLNNKVQNVKIKSILNNSRSSSRNRRNSSSKHVVIIEPTDVKKKSLDLDDKRKIKIKKKFNQNRRKNLSNQNILIEKTNNISNNTNYSNYENNNTIKINKIIIKKKYNKSNPIENNFQLFQRGFVIFNIIGIILGIFLIYHIYNLFALFSIFNNMYMYLSSLEVIILFTICFLNINLCLKEINNDYSEKFNSYMKNAYYKSIFINTCQMGFSIFIFYLANYYQKNFIDEVYTYLIQESFINIFYFILICNEVIILIFNLFLEEYYNLQIKEDDENDNDLRECLL